MSERPGGRVAPAESAIEVPEVYYELPPALATNAAAWIDSGQAPAPSKDASTVMLLRDGSDAGLPAGAGSAGAGSAGAGSAGAGTPGGLEVFVLHRAATMAFAPSVYVFPGGGVDARDADETLPWAGPSPAQWAARLAAPTQAQARELVVAAARELFEECGVLLAGPDADTVVADLTGPEWDEARAALIGRDLSFAEFLVQRGLVLRTDLLRAVDHWITPEFEPRRYDTRFFVAALPAGQVPDDDCTEAEHVRWVRPADLLAEQRAGSALLLPPTEVCLRRLEPASADSLGGNWDGSVAGVLAALDDPTPLPVVLPVAVRTDHGVRLLRTWVPPAPGPA